MPFLTKWNLSFNFIQNSLCLTFTGKTHRLWLINYDSACMTHESWVIKSSTKKTLADVEFTLSSFVSAFEENI